MTKTEKTNKKIKATPEPTLRRLPRYLHLLKFLRETGDKSVSSTYIAKELGFDPTQVRKDIEYTGIVGRPKTGFNIVELISSIEEFLNWKNITDAFLVGTGSLGTAMLGYGRFKDYGLNFVAAFDNNEMKIGKTIHETPVLSMEKLVDLAKRMHINIGVITVPAFAAQHSADLLIEGGIRAIWNFAPIHLKVPEGVLVENAQLTQSLAVLTHKLADAISKD
ncbi:MAG: redox-sensing transcriptional repressor Rex [Melioribacteraceae bacterium]|nr:MAG: redox-sensing transcriptional repressor Rex [Melioribacteraceae bacterium]